MGASSTDTNFATWPSDAGTVALGEGILRVRVPFHTDTVEHAGVSINGGSPLELVEEYPGVFSTAEPVPFMPGRRYEVSATFDHAGAETTHDWVFDAVRATSTGTEVTAHGLGDIIPTAFGYDIAFDAAPITVGDYRVNLLGRLGHAGYGVGRQMANLDDATVTLTWRELLNGKTEQTVEAGPGTWGSVELFSQVAYPFKELAFGRAAESTGTIGGLRMAVETRPGWTLEGATLELSTTTTPRQLCGVAACPGLAVTAAEPAWFAQPTTNGSFVGAAQTFGSPTLVAQTDEDALTLAKHNIDDIAADSGLDWLGVPVPRPDDLQSYLPTALAMESGLAFIQMTELAYVVAVPRLPEQQTVAQGAADYVFEKLIWVANETDGASGESKGAGVASFDDFGIPVQVEAINEACRSTIDCTLAERYRTKAERKTVCVRQDGLLSDPDSKDCVQQVSASVGVGRPGDKHFLWSSLFAENGWTDAEYDDAGLSWQASGTNTQFWRWGATWAWLANYNRVNGNPDAGCYRSMANQFTGTGYRNGVDENGNYHYDTSSTYRSPTGIWIQRGNPRQAYHFIHPDGKQNCGDDDPWTSPPIHAYLYHASVDTKVKFLNGTGTREGEVAFSYGHNKMEWTHEFSCSASVGTSGGGAGCTWSPHPSQTNAWTIDVQLQFTY